MTNSAHSSYHRNLKRCSLKNGHCVTGCVTLIRKRSFSYIYIRLPKPCVGSSSLPTSTRLKPLEFQHSNGFFFYVQTCFETPFTPFSTLLDVLPTVLPFCERYAATLATSSLFKLVYIFAVSRMSLCPISFWAVRISTP